MADIVKENDKEREKKKPERNDVATIDPSQFTALVLDSTNGKNTMIRPVKKEQTPGCTLSDRASAVEAFSTLNERKNILLFYNYVYGSNRPFLINL